MMTLPTFDNPYPSDKELLDEQRRLHSQADKMMEGTGLRQILEMAGPLGLIGGSYGYNLMAYPDLDLEIVSSSIDKNALGNLVADLIRSKYVRKVSTANTVDFPSLHAGRPTGYWIGIEIPYENEKWGIDCWLQKPEWVESTINPYEQRLKNISQDQATAILAIKHYLIYEKLYGKSFYSVSVYDEVLDEGVRSVDEFKKKHSLK